MKYSVIAKAYKSLVKLSGEKFTLKISYDIYKLIKCFQPHIDFEVEQINALFDKYNVHPDENGKINFEDAEKSKEFMNDYDEKMKDLLDLDVEIEPPKINIPLTEDLMLTPVDVEALEPFINFV